MVKSVEQWSADNAIKRSRQERMDKAMCRPGYSWNETIGKCLPPAGYGENSAPDLQNPAQRPDKPANPGVKIALEGATRAAKQ